MKVGRRLAIKILNASKFVLSRPAPRGAVTVPVDRGLLQSLAGLVRESTVDLEGYNYTRVLERAETFFWSFCDDYLELVKGRRYGDQGEELAASANGALFAALDVMLRLFAPFLPFVTDEVWSWWKPGSIHRAPWPSADELLAGLSAAPGDDSDIAALEFAAVVLGAIRKKKSEEQRPLKTPVARAIISAPPAQLRLLPLVEHDLRAAGLIREIETSPGEALAVDVQLAAAEASQEKTL
jgi:valyl-tRNA synthetase